MRAGRGKSRGRRYKTKKSVLIVVSRPTALSQSARSIPGVNVCVARELNADVLAPGGLMGRVTVYTEAALKEIAKM